MITNCYREPLDMEDSECTGDYEQYLIDALKSDEQGRLMYSLLQAIGRKALEDGYVDTSNFPEDPLLIDIFRSAYTTMYAWFIPDRKWVRKFCAFLRKENIHTVLEVAGGSGFTAALVTTWMSKQYPTHKLNWICTDVYGSSEPSYSKVQKFTAVDAAKNFVDQADLLFFSWWPFQGDEQDILATKEFLNADKSVVVVGETGGCTGSEFFHEPSYSGFTAQYTDWGPKSFPGIRDRTSIIRQEQ